MDIKRLVIEMYDHESEKDFRDSTRKMLSISLGANQASMLRAISERFGKSLSSFAGEILHDAIEETFLFLSQEDKDALALKADTETTQFLKSKCIDGDITYWTKASKFFSETGITPDEAAEDRHQALYGEGDQ